MTNQIIYDPTRGWLLLTENWPGGEFPETMDNINLFIIHRNSCLSTAVEIAKEDLKDIVILGLWDEAEDHHPYSVDAEFEVKEQYRNTVFNDAEWHDYDPKLNGPKDAEPGEFEYRKIARLVKAKVGTDEERGMVNLTHVIVDEDNPTDSVTSDGAKAKEYVPDWENSKIIYATDQTGEKRLFINGEEWVKKPKPTESQDELWKDLIDVYDVEDRKGYGYATLIKALSARFKIERI